MAIKYNSEKLGWKNHLHSAKDGKDIPLQMLVSSWLFSLPQKSLKEPTDTYNY